MGGERRVRIFVGCEGESEAGFRAWLQDLCDEHGLFVHLDQARMKGGDPLTLVQGALERRRKSTRSAGVGHRHSLLFIDADRLGDGSMRSRNAIRLAEDERLMLIRHAPCFEGILLRLHRGHEEDFPSSALDAEHRLRQLWPKYQKPMTRRQIAAHFVFADLQRLARVDADVRRLLEILGLPQLR